jgi:excinuclease ABC subunit A
MYIYEALDFFHELDHIKEELELMVEIGLWYLKMWQPAHTLSGWESQRLKLVKHLLKEYRGNTVYFLDEPTVWLHPADIERLLKVLKRFLDKWDTILMIEHDQDILQFADHIIKLDNWKIINQ